MWRISLFLVGVLMTVRAFGQERRLGDLDTLPYPRKVADDDAVNDSVGELERLLYKLKNERDGLTSDWHTLKKHKQTPSVTVEAEQSRLEAQLRDLLLRLKQRERATPEPGSTAATKQAQADPTEVDAKPIDKTPAPAPPRIQEAVDSLAQAHALMRNKQYEEALKAFEQVDLKVRKSDDRGPIQYLKACCLLSLGRSKEAAELLQEVANLRGDEKFAGYAQWQLELLRWRRDIDQRLQEIRARHQALEKR